MQSKPVICVADDDIDVREVICAMLTRAGYRAVGAADGNQLLRDVERTKAATVVLDIVMPDREGLSTIAELKQRFPATRILAISGGGASGLMCYLDIARKLGADDALSKPFSQDQLLAKIDALTIAA